MHTRSYCAAVMNSSSALFFLPAESLDSFIFKVLCHYWWWFTWTYSFGFIFWCCLVLLHLYNFCNLLLWHSHSRMDCGVILLLWTFKCLRHRRLVQRFSTNVCLSPFFFCSCQDEPSDVRCPLCCFPFLLWSILTPVPQRYPSLCCFWQWIHSHLEHMLHPLSVSSYTQCLHILCVFVYTVSSYTVSSYTLYLLIHYYIISLF